MSDDNTLYQALIVTKVDDSATSGFSGSIRTELWTKPKSQFPDSIQRNLPSKGAMLNIDFLPVINSDGTLNQNNLAKNSAARNLLQYRKLSQLVAKSWLHKGDLIRRLILTADLAPDTYQTSIPLESLRMMGINESPILFARFSDNQIQNSTRIDPLYDLAALPPIDERTLPFRSSIILPDGLNWRYIRLSLLCAGQAYVKVSDNEYSQINEPIFSNYDVCVNYAFTAVSWSEYLATSVELVQPGHNQIPPYYKVTFPYPPRPNLDKYSLLSEEDIMTWANAPEAGGELPFYPRQENGNYVSELVKNVVPPYPYIPATSS